jgi:hypothetical protein
MVRPKIVVQQRPLVPLLLYSNEIAFVAILKKKTAFAAGDLKRSFGYVLTSLQKFALFVNTGTDFDQKILHGVPNRVRHLIETGQLKLR